MPTDPDTRPLSREEAERLLRYFRGYWLLWDRRGGERRWIPEEDRRVLMDDDAIRMAAEEFVVFNLSR